ncbi:unnamed protein product [Rotaria sp. Silwood2]|nr:unnamed protein product [Rotaria sp. Silwood2]CAF3270649.1 unnamed protein product [Rotaria sp. Silwood2]CAF3927283.1 unnamed protein product [Rotaria sp. Silwood2]CAF4273420.1 unnamed protein product [Rotaria sp. Silwood2]
MASTASLQEKFNAAVKAIQRLPSDGSFQPSNEMKLTFYGLYKQATAGPCKEPRPSLFNYINRAKWDAWDRCRSMTKESAMTAYIDEIRKILETMPQTNEVLEFTQLIGPFYEFVDDQTEENQPISLIKKKSHHTNIKKKKPNTLGSLSNGTGENDYDEHSMNHTNGPIQTIVSSGNGPVPSSSPSSSSSSISSSDAEEFYDDPPDRLSLNPSVSNDEMISKENLQTNEPPSTSNIPPEQPSNNTTKYHPHVYGGQDGSNVPVHRSHRGSNHSNEFHGLSTHSSYRHHNPSDGARYSFSSVASGGGGNGRHPNNNYNKETQRAILAALTKLQRDVNNILERLNRLETSSHFLQQTRFSLMASITSGTDSEHLGIPKAVFVEDVDSFMQQPENDSADTVIRRLDDLNSKYRFMEMNLLQKKKRLRGKLPDIQICLDMVEQLRKYRENGSDMDTNFLLAHNLYGKATIPPTDKVCLWLGANVMLEYTLDEAEELLRGNQKTAQTTLEKVDEDLDFLRDQITTTEVNMARLHNWAVKQRQQNKK